MYIVKNLLHARNRKTRREYLSIVLTIFHYCLVMASASTILHYKRRIKEWEKSFFEKNGKIPSKTDVKAEKEIWKAYKTYNQLKAKEAESSKENETKSKKSKHAKEEEHAEKPEGEGESGDEKTIQNSPQQAPSLHAEFGPTPQANGKVLSIFDMVMSPPESSPLKGKRSVQIESSFSSPTKPVSHLPSPKKHMSSEVFKTPTKAPRKLQFADLTPSNSSPSKKSLLSRLQQVSSPEKEPAPQNVGTETPLYLGKINKKFLFKDEEEEASPVKQHEPSTPTKMSLSPANFNTTPSPLKPERLLSFGSRKKLSDLFHECQNLEIDEEFEAQKVEIEQEIEAGAVNGNDDKLDESFVGRKRKRITQKRTTRRWKIKPRGENDEATVFEGKDVHAELQKMHEEEQKQLNEYMASGVNDDIIPTDDDDNDDDDTFVRPEILKPRSMKSKNLSANYQRLKINDPRSKRFKQRMKRR